MITKRLKNGYRIIMAILPVYYDTYDFPYKGFRKDRSDSNGDIH